MPETFNIQLIIGTSQSLDFGVGRKTVMSNAEENHGFSRNIFPCECIWNLYEQFLNHNTSIVKLKSVKFLSLLQDIGTEVVF